MPDLFKYLDYRKFLSDSFAELKNTKPSFSHRSFARQAGFSSSNYVMLVMQGRRNLSGEGIQKIAKAIKLRRTEAEFFENLVRFNQASSDSEKNFYYGRIASNKKYAKARPLEKGQFEYYSRWYVPAIREMVLLSDFNEEPSWIASKLNPPITAREAESALNLLLNLGLLERDESGRLVQKDKHIASGDEVASLAVTNFQKEMITRAAASVDKTPAHKREIGSVTVAVTKDKLKEAKKRIREFRTQLAGFLAEGGDADAVYQFNIQLFGLSNMDEKE